MRGFAVDENNDLYLGPTGNLAMSFELAAVMQKCAHAMKAILDEMVFHQGRGQPYFETVWNDAPSLRAFENVARGTLNALSGVKRVTEFVASADAGVLRYQATISTVYGTDTLSGEVANG